MWWFTKLFILMDVAFLPSDYYQEPGNSYARSGDIFTTIISLLAFLVPVVFGVVMLRRIHSTKSDKTKEENKEDLHHHE